jgi:hypothetical protein
MMRLISVPVARAVFVFAFLFILASKAFSLDLYADPTPQSTSQTCQSYAMMLALAAEGDPAFPIATFGELRAAEQAFRTIAEATPGGPYGHGALGVALKSYTGDAYRLVIEDRPDIVAFLQRVRELTTLTSARDVLLAQLTGKNFPVVMTSVTAYAGNTYATGHIITLLGVAGSGINSTTEIVAFNSAVKGSGSINRCEPGMQPGDLRYTAGVTTSNDFTLKAFGGSYRILRLVPN